MTVYTQPPAGSLRVSWESVTRVGSMAGLVINSQWVRGAGRGGPLVHPQRESCQLVSLASVASFNKERTLESAALSTLHV